MYKLQEETKANGRIILYVSILLIAALILTP